MQRSDVLVIGGGVSGACFAHHAARAGRSVRVVEREPRVGGCLHSCSAPSGFWYELGAHTCYNSYGALLEVLEACGLLPELQARGKPVLRFLDGGRVLPGKNLGLLLRRFSKLELLAAVPRWIGASQEGQTVRSYYARLVGRRNYERVLGPMLSAVPSQRADDFPADMLFKKRPRREDVLRSFTLRGGLQKAVEGILGTRGVEVTTGRAVTGLERAGEGWSATLDDGAHLRADLLALATPPGAAAALLREVEPQLAARLAGLKEARVESLAFALEKDAAKVPYATFLIPLDDAFHSIVTRDVVPDEAWRGFTFHFRPGLSRDDKLRRAEQVLGVGRASMQAIEERTTVLPSPVLGHAATVAEVDRALAGRRLALTGNWFGGLAIEDCALRSRAEWRRVAALD